MKKMMFDSLRSRPALLALLAAATVALTTLLVVEPPSRNPPSVPVNGTGELSGQAGADRREPLPADPASRDAETDGTGAPLATPPPSLLAEQLQSLSATDSMRMHEHRSTSALAAKVRPDARGTGGQLMAMMHRAAEAPAIAPPVADREGYAEVDDNPVQRAAENPVSTFSIDVDTASYANVRRFLNQGNLPPPAAVRVEELINYFSYDYPSPGDDEPFSVYTEVGPSPWHGERRLLHVGLRGAAPAADEMGPANLVFLVDVSGSMRSRDKLPLLKQSLRLLTAQLGPEDRVAMAVYAGAAGVVLESTAGDQQASILGAIERLEAGGSTNGGAGIQLAYDLARQGFVEGGVNRVILATDGDFNVGNVNHGSLEALVERRREEGIALTVLGFGTGNYQDALMQRLAQIGNGNAAYIDSLNEARKVLVEELTSTLAVIARDVKVQVEFNPAIVAEYRLIGYETRQLAREDFRNDRVDAGDVGAGHTVTALYEIALVDGGGSLIDPLRYPSTASAPAVTGRADELAHLRLRYKQPGGSTSVQRDFPLRTADMLPTLDATSENFRFSAAVAAYGQLLTGGRYTGQFTYDEALDLARDARGRDTFGYRGEFLGLLQTARVLSGRSAAQKTVMQRE